MDLTVAAIPFYFSTMAAEAWWLGSREEGPTEAVGYERADSVTSLAMGVGSLVSPLLLRPLSLRLDPGRTRAGKLALGVAVASCATAVGADALARVRELTPGEVPDNIPAGSAQPVRETRGGKERLGDRLRRRLRNRLRDHDPKVVAGRAALVGIASGVAVAAGTWANRTMAKRLHPRRILPDWGSGFWASMAAIAGWDFIYYWNHRLQHESRFMWAIHVVHHSSERYNLSTALRQPVAEGLGLFVPYGILSLLGCRPELIERARGVNLLYQYWIHTEVIRSIGAGEAFLNTPSHHRVHHGANRQYLDRNHGSILIVWDKLFGTFEPEDERVTYGLTKNIRTHNVLRVATHEYRDMASDVVAAQDWQGRLGHVFRGPGWGRQRRAEPAGAAIPAA